MQSLTYKKVVNIYKYIWFILTIFELNRFIGHYLLRPTAYIMGIGAILLICYDVFHKKHCLNTKDNICLFLFAVFYGCTCILRFQYSFAKNIFALMWLVIFFFFFAVYDKNESLDQMKKFVKSLVHIMVIATLIASVLSVLTAFLKIGGRFEYRPEDMPGVYAYIGVYGNRLFGVLWDPNYGSIFCMVGALCSLLSFKYFPFKKLPKWVIVTSLVFQYLYIAMAESRTAKISIVILFSMLIFGWLYHKGKEVSIGILIRNSVLSICVVTVLLVSMIPVKIGVSALANLSPFNMSPYIEQCLGDRYERSLGSEGEINLVREDISDGNLSNGRLEIWKDAYNIWKDMPIFGVSARGYIDYSQEAYPDSYMSVKEKSIHNDYIAYLTCSGIAGFAVFLIYGIRLFVRAVRYLIKYKNSTEESRMVWVLLSLLISLLVAGCFIQIFSYLRNWSTTVFFMIIGLLQYLTDPRDKDMWLYKVGNRFLPDFSKKKEKQIK